MNDTIEATADTRDPTIERPWHGADNPLVALHNWMIAELATLDELLADFGDGELRPFVPGALYYEPMDCVIYLKEDVSYRADRIDAFLTLLWHPRENKAVGVKLKGFRWLFQRWQAFCQDEKDLTVPDESFVPLVKAIEIALTARLGEMITSDVESERKEERARIEKSYQCAREIVDSVTVTVDPREMMEAA